MKKKDNVVLFPKWKEKVERDVQQAIEDERFEDALEQINTYELNSDKQQMDELLCHMRLGNFHEAQALCEKLLVKDNEYYFDILHIYVSVLFQTEQHQLLQDTVQETIELKTIPRATKEQLELISKMSMEIIHKIVAEEKDKYVSQLEEAIRTDNHVKQWQMVENIQRMNALPTRDIIQLLEKQSIHPVVKTSIVRWIRNQSLAGEFVIQKLGQTETFLATELEGIRSDEPMRSIMSNLSEIEQENPSLYILLNQLLYRYLYTLYPIVPKQDEFSLISNALQSIGSELLMQHDNEELCDTTRQFKEQIKQYEALYLSVIDE
ncbi:MAG TPA: hypothetical protein VK125_04040 [Bacillota bacterium]|nr:hypothetical protein [Bacillota bacterium]